MTDTELAVAIGKAIKRTRKRRGYSQGEIAAAIGVYQKDISNLESGRHLPKIGAIVAVFTAMDFDVVRIVAGRRGDRAAVIRLT